MLTHSNLAKSLNILTNNDMLLSDTINPANMIYYRGALVLKALQDDGNMTLSSLYSRMKEKYDMNYHVLIHCLDWLYLLDAVKIDKHGEVQLCI